MKSQPPSFLASNENDHGSYKLRCAKRIITILVFKLLLHKILNDYWVSKKDSSM
jgi:hypothetical protein